MGGTIPESILSIVAAATVFAVMFDLGVGIVPRELFLVGRHPGTMVKGLFSVLVAVPAIALVVAKVFELPRAVEIGIVLMAISPGAPVALRRSLDAGGHRSFAPALQIAVAVLAVASMPLSIAALNHVYAGHATIDPAVLARQVFVAQLMPLALGMLLRHTAPRACERIERTLGRIANALLLALTLLVLVDIAHVVWGAGPRIALAIACVTGAALAAGHWLGGPDPGTRTAVAISSAARNPGLALLVATLNSAPAEVVAAVLAYLLVSAFVIVAYVVVRRRRAKALAARMP
jgi:BASS family bile acid:Na+ symporter